MNKKRQLKQNNSPKPEHKGNIPSKLDELNSVLKTLPPDKNKEIKEKIHSLQHVSYMESISYSGPIPHPDILKKYNEAIPDGAERILTMAEKQSDHRMSMEKFAIENQFKQSAKGQIFGFILALLIIFFGGILSYLGHEIIGSTLVGSTLVSIVSVFFAGKKKQKKNLSEKNPNKN